MIRFPKIFASVAIGAVFALASAGASAQMDHSQMQHSQMDHAQMQQAQGDALTAGEIQKVDKDSGKLTIKHGNLVNLKMPAMTMSFAVQDRAMLDQVKTGDQVRFRAEVINGALAVTRLEVAQ